MRVKKYQMIVDEVLVEVWRKKIKHLHLVVYPPDGRVRVSVPMHVDDETVRQVVISKLPWIRRQQSRFEGQEMHTRREYVSGEGHYFQGRRYLLEVIVHDAPEKVILRGDTHIELYVRPGSDAVQRERVLLGWYRQQLKRAIPALIDQWEAIVGVEIAEWRIKQMRTRWGSCNVKKRRIWLNLELAKRSTQCLEYIIVHELVHLLERRHNAHFKALMDRFMPQWRQVRAELNQNPLMNERRE